jgi:NTE family protein
MSGHSQTAFVFAGGGSLGAIQVGMLKALVAHGIEADLVVGCSVGAINAACFAGDPTPGGVARLEAVWRGLRRSDVFPVPLLRSLMGVFSKRDHLVDPSPLRRLIDRNLTFERLEETRLPCHVVATDLLEGIEVRIASGSVTQALLASAAIPGVFPPVRLDGRYLIDGGVANHTPISAAVELGAKRVYVLPTGYSCTMETPPVRAIDVALHGLNILTVGKLVSAVQRFARDAEITVVPPLCPLATSPLDFRATGELIDRAALETENWLANGVELTVDGLPHQFPPHSHRGDGDPYAARTL